MVLPFICVPVATFGFFVQFPKSFVYLPSRQLAFVLGVDGCMVWVMKQWKVSNKNVCNSHFHTHTSQNQRGVLFFQDLIAKPAWYDVFLDSCTKDCLDFALIHKDLWNTYGFNLVDFCSIQQQQNYMAQFVFKWFSLKQDNNFWHEIFSKKK